MATKLKLYSSWFCPFAERIRIALLEKELPFEYVEIDPFDKTPEFLAINPRGFVPVILLEDGRSVYESAVCIEFTDELQPEKTPLMPRDPFGKAQVRIWSDFISKKVVPTFYKILQSQDRNGQDEAKKTLLDALATFSAAIDEGGPFFWGETLGMVDIMLCPFSLRFDTALKHYRDFEVPDTVQYRKLHRWMDACHGHPSVIPTVAEKSKMIEIYKSYSDNVAKSQVAIAIRQGTTLP